MFKKRKWVILSVAIAAIVVAGVVGGAVYANSSGSTTTTKAAKVNPQTVLADKVAGILGLDNNTVEAAFTQAQKEINSERSAERLAAQEARLDKMVADGKITAAEAAKIKTWLESKPDVSVQGWGEEDGGGPGFGPECGPGGRGGMRGPGMMQRGFGNGSTDETDSSDTGTN
jgi:hypothetical protein